MQMTGLVVRHKLFGDGTITESNEKTVTVRFLSGNRKFLFPDGFQRFLSFADDDAQARMDATLHSARKKEQDRQQTAQAHYEKRQRLRNLKILANSQAVFDVKGAGETGVTDWSVSTGCYLSGFSKGQPRVPDRLQPNSVCLLTACPAGKPERERRLLGAFMVREDFFGDLCQDGRIAAHDDYRLAFTPKTAPRFWDYFAETERKQRWGGTPFKYLPNDRTQDILLDLRTRTQDGPDGEIADGLYRYFCRINRLSSGLPDLEEPQEAED